MSAPVDSTMSSTNEHFGSEPEQSTVVERNSKSTVKSKQNPDIESSKCVIKLQNQKMAPERSEDKEGNAKNVQDGSDDGNGCGDGGVNGDRDVSKTAPSVKNDDISGTPEVVDKSNDKSMEEAESEKAGEIGKMKKRKRDKTKEEEEIDALVRDIESSCEADGGKNKQFSKTAAKKGTKIETNDAKKDATGTNEEGKEALTTKRKKKNKKKDDKNNNPLGEENGDVKDEEMPEKEKKRTVQNESRKKKVKHVDDNKDESNGQNKREAEVSVGAEDSKTRSHSPSKKRKTKKKAASNVSDLQREDASDSEMVPDDRDDESGKKKLQRNKIKEVKSATLEMNSEQEKQQAKANEQEAEKTEAPDADLSESQKRKKRRKKKNAAARKKAEEEKNAESTSYEDDLFEKEKMVTRGLVNNHRSPLKQRKRKDTSLKNVGNNISNNESAQKKAVDNNPTVKDDKQSDNLQKSGNLFSEMGIPTLQNQERACENIEGESSNPKTEKQIDRLEMMFSRLSPQQNIMRAINSDQTHQGEHEMAEEDLSATQPRSISMSNKPEIVFQEGVGITSKNTLLGVESGATINEKISAHTTEGACRNPNEPIMTGRDGDGCASIVSGVQRANCTQGAEGMPRAEGMQGAGGMHGAEGMQRAEGTAYLPGQVPTLPADGEGYINRNNPNWEQIYELQRLSWGMQEDTDWAFIYLDTSSDESSSGEDVVGDEGESGRPKNIEGADAGFQRSSCRYQDGNTSSLDRDSRRELVQPDFKPKLPIFPPQQFQLPDIGSFLKTPPGAEGLVPEIPSLHTYAPETACKEMTLSKTECSSQNNQMATENVGKETEFLKSKDDKDAFSGNIDPKVKLQETVGPQSLVCHPIYALNNPHFVNGVEERIGTDKTTDTNAEYLTLPPRLHTDTNETDNENSVVLDDKTDENIDANTIKSDKKIGEIEEVEDNTKNMEVAGNAKEKPITEGKDTVAETSKDNELCFGKVASKMYIPEYSEVDKVVDDKNPTSPDSVNGDNEQLMNDSLNSTLSADETLAAEAALQNGDQSHPETVGNGSRGDAVNGNSESDGVQNGDNEKETATNLDQGVVSEGNGGKSRSQTAGSVHKEPTRSKDSNTENKENERSLADIDQRGIENGDQEMFEVCQQGQTKKHDADCPKSGDNDGNAEQCKCMSDNSKDVTNGFNNALPKTIEKLLEGIDSFHEKNAVLAKQKLEKVCEDAFSDLDVNMDDLPIEVDDTDCLSMINNGKTDSDNERSTLNPNEQETNPDRKIKVGQETQDKMLKANKTECEDKKVSDRNDMELECEEKTPEDIPESNEEKVVELEMYCEVPKSTSQEQTEQAQSQPKDSETKELDTITTLVEKPVDVEIISSFLPDSFMIAEKPTPAHSDITVVQSAEMELINSDEITVCHEIIIMSQDDDFTKLEPATVSDESKEENHSQLPSKNVEEATEKGSPDNKTKHPSPPPLKDEINKPEADSKPSQKARDENAALKKLFRERALKTLEEEASIARDDVEVTFKKHGNVIDCVINLEPDDDKTMPNTSDPISQSNSNDSKEPGQSKVDAHKIPTGSNPANTQDDSVFKKPKFVPKYSKRNKKDRKAYEPPTVPNEDPQAKEARLRQKAHISQQFRRRLSELQNQRRKSKKEPHEKPRKQENDEDEHYTKDEIANRIHQRISELSVKTNDNDKEIRHIQRVLGRSDFPRDEQGNVIPHCLHCGRVSNRLRSCVRCGTARYCSRGCQAANYPEHKDRCFRLQRWTQVQTRIDPCVQEVMARCLMKQIRRFKYIPDPWMEGCGRALLARIVHPFFFYDRIAAKVEDMAGDGSKVIFTTPNYEYYPPEAFVPPPPMSNTFIPPPPVHLYRCLQPDMFIIILGAVWHRYPDESVGIPVHNMSQVYFIDAFCKSKLVGEDGRVIESETEV